MKKYLLASVLLLSSAGFAADTRFQCRSNDRNATVRAFSIVVGTNTVTGSITRHNVIGFPTRRVVINPTSDDGVLGLVPNTVRHHRNGTVEFRLAYSDLYTFRFTLYNDGTTKAGNVRMDSDGDPVTDTFRCR